MKFNTIILSTLLGFAMADDADHRKELKKDIKKHFDHTADQRQCHKMAKLNHLMDLTNNQTLMSRIENNHPERAQKIRDDANRAEPELNGMKKNSTLTKFCGSYMAHERLVKQCGVLKHGERLTSRLRNNTAVEESAKRRHKTTDEIKTRWQMEIDHISRLKSNSTLVDQCNKMKSKDQKKGDKHGDKKADNKKADKADKGKTPEKQKSAAAHVPVAGTGAFALCLSLLVSALML